MMPTSDTRVSIVMATYNGERFLQAQLDSLLTQTLQPSELVVGDDHSDDGTAEILRRFAASAPFPVSITINETRLGYGENFLRTAARATGDYIAFCDQDDEWLPRKLSTAVGVLRRSGAVLHVHTAQVIDGAGAPTGVFRQRIRRSRLLEPLHADPWGVYYGFSMTFRRALLDALPLERRGRHISERGAVLSHDMWLYFLAFSLGRTATDARPLVRYRRHERNETFQVIRPLTMMELTSSLGLAYDEKVGRDRIASDRARLLAELPAAERPTAAAAAQYWRELAVTEAGRAVVYGGGGLPARLRAWVSALLRGGYRSHRSGGLGRPLVVKDALAGVFRLRRRENRGMHSSAESAPTS